MSHPPFGAAFIFATIFEERIGISTAGVSVDAVCCSASSGLGTLTRP